jgi:hypothetical protein
MSGGYCRKCGGKVRTRSSPRFSKTSKSAGYLTDTPEQRRTAKEADALLQNFVKKMKTHFVDVIIAKNSKDKAKKSKRRTLRSGTPAGCGRSGRRSTPAP